MGLGTALAIRGPWDDVVEQATLVESLGYDSIWIPEIAGRDAIATCAALATATNTIELATGIVPLPVRSVPTLAMGAATVAELSGGRFTLGVGAGHPETLTSWFDVQPPGFDEIETAFNRLKTILTDGTSGDFRLRGVHHEAPPRLALAALGPRMVDLARRVADAIVLYWVTPEFVADLDLDGIDVVCYIPTCVTDDLAAARNELARQLTAYAPLSAYRRVLERSGLAWDGDRPPDHVLDALGAFGDAEAVQSRITAFREAGVTHPVLSPYPVGEDAYSSMLMTWTSLDLDG